MTKEATRFTTEADRWTALGTRDKSAMDGFIYAVKSTDVYCRPLCGSRLPRKDNVVFYNTTSEAERGGFRACKQCKPNQPLIRYTIARSKLGLALIAANRSGVCAINFGSSQTALVSELNAEFATAKLVAADETMEEFTATVLAAINGASESGSLRLDQSGTAFQTKVWLALSRVPRGETRTYSEIASEIGEPKATRAVALACAANRLAVVVPCHRVIRQDGSLSGYRWGAERKRALLEREGVRL